MRPPPDSGERVGVGCMRVGTTVPVENFELLERVSVIRVRSE